MVAGACGAFVALMVGASYAAVPLYDWFCRATGFNGTTQVATGAPGQMLDRMVTVRFDANVGPGLPWKFTPESNEIQARLGEVVTVDYTVTNLVARETHGVAGYNVTPLAWGAYFQKINCFCFTEQTLRAGRDPRHDGRVLCRPGAGGRPGRAGQPEHDAVIHILSAARAAAAGRTIRSCARGTHLGADSESRHRFSNGIMLNVKRSAPSRARTGLRRRLKRWLGVKPSITIIIS